MSDPEVFVFDFTNAFVEIDPSNLLVFPATQMAAARNPAFRDKNNATLEKMFSVHGGCCAGRTPPIGVTIELKAPVVDGGENYTASSLFFSIAKDKLTDHITKTYKVSDTVTYNNVTYGNENQVLVVVQEGQSISLTGDQGFGVAEINQVGGTLRFFPGSGPSVVVLSLTFHCDVQQKSFVAKNQFLIISKEVAKNFSIDQAQKMFGLTPKDQAADQKTGMLEFVKPKDLKLGFLPTKTTQAAIFGG